MRKLNASCLLFLWLLWYFCSLWNLLYLNLLVKCSLSPVGGQPFALWWLLNSEFELFVCLYFPGKKVWDEVAEHSKEFIQEYLEEFPNVSKLEKKHILISLPGLKSTNLLIIIPLQAIWRCLSHKASFMAAGMDQYFLGEGEEWVGWAIVLPPPKFLLSKNGKKKKTCQGSHREKIKQVLSTIRIWF